MTNTPKPGHTEHIDSALPSRFGSMARRWVGNLLMLFAFIGIVSISALRNADLGFVGTVLAGAGIGGVSALLGLFGRRLSLAGRKQRAILRAHSLAGDPRPPVLYLRSFGDDKRLEDANVVRGFIQPSTEEEQYARLFTRIGPFVAIGDPREKLPMLGAMRHYVRDDEWRQDVENTLQSARLVVLRLAPTKGVLWELHESISQLDPKRLLLFVPRDPPWETYKSLADQWLPKPLPVVTLPLKKRKWMGTLQSIVYFGDDWTPEVLPMRFHLFRASYRSPLTPHLQIMLRPVFERLGVKWSKPPLGVLPVGFACMWGVIVVGVIVALLSH